MATEWTGNPAAVESPATAYDDGDYIVILIPEDADGFNVTDMFNQQYKVTADYIAGLQRDITTKYPVFNVKSKLYGAIGDGSNDDTAAIRLAITAAEVLGGMVYFPVPGQYSISSQITVSSLYPVHLVSDMYGVSDNNPGMNCIKPLANFGSNAMIRYQSPGGDHSAHGAGSVRGLAFSDPYNGNHTPHFSMLAALDLYDFNFGKVEMCMFHVLLGGAVRSIYWVQGGMTGCVVRYCGSGSQAAISLESGAIVSPAGTALAQSTVILDCKVEANNSVYIRLDSNCAEVKLSKIGCEALTTESPGTNNTFIENAGQRTIISDCHLSRNRAIQLTLTAASNHAQISNIQFNCDAQTVQCLDVNGANHQIRSINVRNATAQTDAAITVPGYACNISGIMLSNSGGVRITGNSYIILSDVQIQTPPSTSGTYAIDCSSSHCRISGAIISGLAANRGGIRINGACGPTSVMNCEVSGVTGITGVAFKDSNSDNLTIWSGNHGYNNVVDFSTGVTSILSGNSFPTSATSQWISPSLIGTWAYFGSGSPPGYFKDGNGFVHVRGLVKDGGTPVTNPVFAFPGGFRPLQTKYFVCLGNAVACLVQVSASTGEISIIAGTAPFDGTTTELSLDSISFLAEQ